MRLLLLAGPLLLQIARLRFVELHLQLLKLLQLLCVLLLRKRKLCLQLFRAMLLLRCKLLLFFNLRRCRVYFCACRCCLILPLRSLLLDAVLDILHFCCRGLLHQPHPLFSLLLDECLQLSQALFALRGRGIALLLRTLQLHLKLRNICHVSIWAHDQPCVQRTSCTGSRQTYSHQPQGVYLLHLAAPGAQLFFK